MSYILKIRSRGVRIECASLSEVSTKYSELRDESDEGASTFPNGAVFEKGTWGRETPVGHVSYNGRIWAPDANVMGLKAVPIYDNAGT